jgi:pimeloyl-ACP methyl ester carboxylesterase
MKFSVNLCECTSNQVKIGIANASYVNHVPSVKLPSGTTYRYVFCPPSASGKRYLLFMHGFPDSSYGWANQIEYFTRHGYGVIAPNMLGYGGTDKPEDFDSYRLNNLSSGLVDFLDCERVG